MKRLSLPGVKFTHVAYLDSRTLLAADYQGGTRVRLWDLVEDTPPREVRWPQARAVLQLFKPHGALFLRLQGLWPEAEELPPAFSDDPNWLPPVLSPVPHCMAFFHPDGETAAFCQTVPGGYYHTRFHLRDAAGQLHELLLTPGTFGFSGDFAPDGSLVALSNGMKVVWVWDLASLREQGQLTQSDSVSALTFISNDRLAVAAGRTIRIWDVNGRREAIKLPAFRKYVEALVVSPDRRLFAAGSRDGSVRVWDATSGREQARYDWGIGGVSALAFSPDGQTAAAAGATGIAVWDLD